MVEFLITYLEPTADERDYAAGAIRFYKGKGLVTFARSFVVVSENEETEKYFGSSRVLQIDIYPDHREMNELIKDQKKSHKAVVYYHKIEAENNVVRRVRCIAANDRPFGFECYLAVDGIGEFFTKTIIPSFKAIVYIPNEKIIGMDVKI